jgi:hypothetical protein
MSGVFPAPVTWASRWPNPKDAASASENGPRGEIVNDSVAIVVEDMVVEDMVVEDMVVEDMTAPALGLRA